MYMMTIFHYAMQSALCLLLLYLPYQLLLRHERFFNLNRAVLLTIMAFSLLAPLFPIESPFPSIIHDDLLAVGMAEGLADQTIKMTSETASLPEADGRRLPLPVLLSAIYLCGLLMAIAIHLYTLLRLYRKIRHGALFLMKRSDGVTIYVHADDTQPYSWFHTIVISENDYNTCREVLLSHECATSGFTIHLTTC